MRVFHAKDGLCFARRHDGSVVVTTEQPMREPDGSFAGRRATITRVVLDVDTWASVVASMSARGENLSTWHAAKRFHEAASNSSVAGSSPLNDWLDSQGQSLGEAPLK